MANIPVHAPIRDRIALDSGMLTQVWERWFARLQLDINTITSGSGVVSHSLLSNLSADDHSQYHTDARGDVRYYTKSNADARYVKVDGSSVMTGPLRILGEYSGETNYIALHGPSSAVYQDSHYYFDSEPSCDGDVLYRVSGSAGSYHLGWKQVS